MATQHNLLGIIVMASIIIFSIIHFGVSIGIIARYRQYQDVFRPQVGLASFNLVISFLGLLTGIMGIIAIIKNADRFAKVIVVIEGVLLVFCVASIISALVMNSKSLDYISSHIVNHQNHYKANAESRTILDSLQGKYRCCGNDLWIDWASAALHQTAPMNNGTTTATVPIANTTTIAARNVREDKNGESSFVQLSYLHRYSRQTSDNRSTYNSVPNLPLTFGVTLPRSCCTSQAVYLNNSDNTYCISNANGMENQIYGRGCSKPIDVTAGDQAMGIGIINCFMLVLALVGMPLLLKAPEVPI